MTHKQQGIVVSTASLLYGAISILAVLLPVNADEFTIRNVVWGGAAVGIATMMTYFLKEVIHREADREETLGFRGYLGEFAHSLPVLIFPVATVTIAVAGLAVGIPADPLIDGLFYFGFMIICAAAFMSSYLIHYSILGASTRMLVWITICLILLLIKRAA